jgi:hypothetical protein
MSDETAQPSEPRVKGYPNLRPFTKDDPRRNRGGLDPKVRRIRKELARLDGKALEVLTGLLASSDAGERVEGLKFWGKYRLPVPTETKAVEVSTPGPRLAPDLAARLAALDA